ncbi:2-oxoacid:acceptor oxidoreductase family protein [Alkalithermobacter paradoxus]|uniref:Pyruvate synthase subunit PorC n=1 Tax=Alkalithermobacter paradoxus TaxID=29349 RepID=A0A1V4I464_9FIRM|nr:pyruvate synthase subunit PorC [[Clostridium] thermoalcaliphilum]
MATEKIICSGFGGQGIMSMGQLLAYAGMLEGKEVSWLPSYGPEMRGGTANCSVIVSDKPVGSPVVTNDCSTAVVMNLPSLLKFESAIVPGGKILINSSLIEDKAERTDITAYYVPANEIAQELGNIKVANMVMLGAYLELTKIVKVETVVEALRKVFGPSKEKLIPINEEALARGAAAVK